MGGSVGEVLDTNLNAISQKIVGTEAGKNTFNIKSSAEHFAEKPLEALTQGYSNFENQAKDVFNRSDLGKMIPNLDPKLPNLEEALPDGPDSSAKSANPFSMGSYGNSMRQRRKSGFGRRQTFKGLTG